MTNINFLLTISVHYQKKRLWDFKNDHLRENALISYQILSTNSLRKSVEVSLENLYVDIRTKRVNKERAKMVVSPSIKRAIWGKHNSSYPVVYFGPKRFLLLSLFISFGCDNVKEYLIRSGTGPSSTPVRRSWIFFRVICVTDWRNITLTHNRITNFVGFLHRPLSIYVLSPINRTQLHENYWTWFDYTLKNEAMPFFCCLRPSSASHSINSNVVYTLLGRFSWYSPDNKKCLHLP